uniref:TF-B3 domain-containing protein n=1 Tax=Daucus carota subsp. sativus TaxID=79200 RepID=A0A166DDP0_DAUCS
MESCGLQAQKFSHKLTHMDTLSDEMMIPRSFCSKYAHDLHEDMELKLRNGYVLPVKFDHSRGVFKGLLCFFKHFKLNGGELLVFEYFGRYNINVYILGSNLSEIKYPDFKFNMPESPPRLVTLGDGGWRFVWFNSGRQTTINEIKLPFDFQQKYANMLPQEFGLNLRTGYRLPVHFDKITGIMMGISTFYSDFGFKGGEVLVFEYYGQSDMNVYVLGLHSCEIDYPMITHLSQCGNPLKPKIRDGGWKFVHFINNLDQLQNEISVPPKFVENCGGNISKFLHFILSNGKSFEGRFCVKSNKLSGLIGMCKLLGLDSLNSFHVLLFTYDGHFSFNIAAFDEKYVEVIFTGTPVSSVGYCVVWNIKLLI